jgi:TolB-like protein
LRPSIHPFAQEKSIAVLPFKDLSAGPERDYLGEGIAEEILTALSKVDNLRVAARRSSFWFKDRDAELSEVAASSTSIMSLKEHSARWQPDSCDCRADRVLPGIHLWSETFEREFQGIFALQDEITCAIVDALKAEIRDCADNGARAQHGSVRSLPSRLVLVGQKRRGSAAKESGVLLSKRWTKIRDSHGAWTGIAKSWLWLSDVYVSPLEGYSKVREAALKRAQDPTTKRRKLTFIWRKPSASSTGISMARRRNTSVLSKSIQTRRRRIILSLLFMAHVAIATRR